METTRQQKIAKQIQRDMAEIFQKEGAEIVRGVLVTVTAVRVSPDFSYAKIYVSVFPFEQNAAVMATLEQHNWFLRRALGQRIRNQLKTVPEIQFFLDDSLEYNELRYSFLAAGAAMIVLLSVLNGFGDFAKSMSSAFDADLTVAPREGQTFASAEIDSLALTRVKGVGVVSYLLEQQVLLERDGLQTMATLRGVDDRYTEVFPIEETIPLGSWSVRTGDLDRLVLGRDMARTLGIRSLVRAEVAVYALRRGSFSSLLPVDGYSVRRLDVGGLFFLDLESENEYALTSLRAAQELFDRPGRISAISVRVADGADAEKVRREIAGIVGDDFTVRTRDEMNALFFRLVAYEKWGVFFISLLVLVLASFSVVGTLVMLMIEKRDDVATLRALGADTKLIRSIFVGEGLLIGGLGASIGAVLGVGFCLAQQHFGMIRIPVDTLLLYSYPVEMRWSDLLIVAAAFGAVILAISELTVRSVMKNNKL